MPFLPGQEAMTAEVVAAVTIPDPEVDLDPELGVTRVTRQDQGLDHPSLDPDPGPNTVLGPGRSRRGEDHHRSLKEGELQGKSSKLLGT